MSPRSENTSVAPPNHPSIVCRPTSWKECNARPFVSATITRGDVPVSVYASIEPSAARPGQPTPTFGPMTRELPSLTETRRTLPVVCLNSSLSGRQLQSGLHATGGLTPTNNERPSGAQRTLLTLERRKGTTIRSRPPAVGTIATPCPTPVESSAANASHLPSAEIAGASP